MSTANHGLQNCWFCANGKYNFITFVLWKNKRFKSLNFVKPRNVSGDPITKIV